MKVRFEFTKTEKDYGPPIPETKRWPPVVIVMEGDDNVIAEIVEKLAEMGEIK